jgi:hypothetical protein
MGIILFLKKNSLLIYTKEMGYRTTVKVKLKSKIKDFK